MADGRGARVQGADGLRACLMLNVAIIGAGPAGVATALSILQCATNDVVVTLYYRRPGQRWTVGETLPPVAYGELNRLGAASVLRPDVHLPCAGSLSVWSTEEVVANDFLLDPHGTGYHLNREQFEAGLRQLVLERGARLCPEHTLRQVHANAKGYQLTFHTAKGDVATEADFVVDASGQNAGFARRLPLPPFSAAVWESVGWRWAMRRAATTPLRRRGLPNR
ncbi:NAD(P)/FAD-dependent oxidoreductase [Marinimicrobium sp. ARAG 43.8]|uniref:NAD(P)/FAD-dependent oxidoreductase n=1 Tax=Marinimicrobium sp. ARAG 43.8 TaxID=3418719 RepID=UPI003CEC82DD